MSFAYELARKRNLPLMILDGDELVQEPIEQVSRVCSFMGIEFRKHFLKWRDGTIREWRVGENRSQKPYHSRLELSNGLAVGKESKNGIVEAKGDQQRILKDATAIYQRIQGEMQCLES